MSTRDVELDQALASAAHDPRSGSTLAQAARPTATTAVEPRALNGVMAELRTLGAVDPAVQSKLMDDLQRTDPSLWPLVTQSYRDTLAFQNRANRSASPASPGVASAGSERAGSAGMPAEIAAARGGIAPIAAHGADPSLRKAPWSALDVPSVARTDQVVLQANPQQATAAGLPSATAVSATAAPVAVPPSPAQVINANATPVGGSEPPLLAAATGGVTQAVLYEPVSSGASTGRSPIEQASFSAVASATDPAAVAAAIAALEKQGAATTRDAADVSRQVSLRMLYLAAGRREEALRPIEGVSLAEQEYWHHQLAGIAAWLDVRSTPDNATRAAAAGGQLTEATTRLAELSPLALRNLAFCSEVASYGVVTPFKEREFAAGQQVLLYAEVENFKSAPAPGGFRTVLRSSYQVFDKQGNRIAGADPQTMEEVCRNPRRDYFVRYRLNLPQPLAEGAYTLQLAIEDTLSQKSARSSIEFAVKEKK